MPNQDALTKLDRSLWRALTATQGGPRSVVLAVLVRGLSEGWPPDDIRQWMFPRVRSLARGLRPPSSGVQHGSDEHTRGSGAGAAATRASDVDALITSGAAWSQLCVAARTEVESSPSANGVVDPAKLRKSRLDTATKLTVGMVMPLSDTEQFNLATNVGARVALGCVGGMLLDDERGLPGVLLSNLAMATMEGRLEATGRLHLLVAAERGLLQRVRGGQGVLSRYKLAPVDRDRRARVANEYQATINALADGTPDSIADVIRSVRHPAWGYSSTLKHSHWLILLADVTGRPVSEFGVTKRMEQELRRETLLPAAVAPSLNFILDLVAEDPEQGNPDRSTGEQISARQAALLASELAAETSRIRRETAIANTTVRDNIRAGLNLLLEEYPAPFALRRSSRRSEKEDQAEAAGRWVQSMRSAIVAANPDDTFLNGVAPLLTKILLSKGAPAGWAPAAVAYISHGDIEARAGNPASDLGVQVGIVDGREPGFRPLERHGLAAAVGSR